MKCITVLLSFMVLSVGVLIFATGCEDKPDTDGASDFFDGRDLRADTRTPTKFPERASPQAPGQETMVIGPAGELRVDTDGAIVEITLTGADGAVSWNLAYPAIGQLVTTSRSGATYRRTGSGDNVVTATDSSGRSVSKVVKQPAAPAPPVVEPEDLVVVGPAEPIVLESDGMIAGLTLTGAQGSVIWTVSNGDRGVIVTQSSTGATYQRLSAGDNVVTAEDASGRSSFKVIRQP